MSCSDCISFSKELRELHDSLYPDGRNPNPLPFQGSFELTLRCNVRCRHCYILYPGATDGEMNTEQCKTIFDKLAAGGCVFLLLTGGEVLTRPDFKELYLHAKRLGLVLSVYTNGTLIDRDIVDFWKEYPPRRIEITIYGHTEETYEKVTNCQGSFKRFRRGCDLLLEAGVPLQFKMAVMKSNIHEYEQIREWAGERCSDFEAYKDIFPSLDGGTKVLEERISPEQYLALDLARPNFANTYAEDVMDRVGHSSGEEAFLCGAGVKTFHVDPTGTMHSCMLYRKNGYDLLNRPLDFGWREHIARQRELKITDKGCNSCSQRGTCGRCPAASVLETGDEGRSLPYFCEITQLRKQKIGLPKLLTLETI